MKSTVIKLPPAREWTVEQIITRSRKCYFEMVEDTVGHWVFQGESVLKAEAKDKKDGLDFTARFTNTKSDRKREDVFPFSVQLGDVLKRISKVYGPYSNAISDDEKAFLRKLPGDYTNLHILSYIPKAKLNELLAQDDSPISPTMSRAACTTLKKKYAPVQRKAAKKAAPKKKPVALPETLDDAWGPMKKIFNGVHRKKQRAIEIVNLARDVGLSDEEIIQAIKGES